MFHDSIEKMLAQKARLAGKDKFKSHYPCNKRGHGRWRYVKGGGCVQCSDAHKRRVAARGGKAARTGRSASPEYRLWQAARRRAEENALEFTIEIADIVIPDTCPVFGTPMVSPSLDRFDNNLGYTRNNIRVISRRANTIKSDATLDEILAIARYMSTFENLLG